MRLRGALAAAAYGAFFAVGILFGLAAAWQVSRLPEAAGLKQDDTAAFLPRVLEGLRDRAFRRLTAVMFLKNAVLAMAGPFLIVFFKRVYQHTDGNVVYLTLASNAGVLIMAVLTGLLMDRVGSKPLFVTDGGLR